MASGGETGNPRHDAHQNSLDPERILRQLNDARVEYALIGGVAVVIHGYERLTGDLDFARRARGRTSCGLWGYFARCMPGHENGPKACLFFSTSRPFSTATASPSAPMPVISTW
jgi:hypothetical protein